MVSLLRILDSTDREDLFVSYRMDLVTGFEQLLLEIKEDLLESGLALAESEDSFIYYLHVEHGKLRFAEFVFHVDIDLSIFAGPKRLFRKRCLYLKIVGRVDKDDS